MKEREEKLFFEFVHKRTDTLNDQPFSDPADFEWTPLLETNYQTIYDEVMTFFENHQKDFYPYFSDELMNAPGKWRSFGFYFWGMRASKSTCANFTKTLSLLKSIPGIVSASISIMEPESEIKPHYGDTNAIYRCHYGLVIPSALPDAGFQAGYEQRSWEQGKFLIFNDAAYHKAWNHTSQNRIILILDVIRPEFRNRTLWICARVHSILFSQKLIAKNRHMEKVLRSPLIQWSMALYTWLKLGLFKRREMWL